MKIMTRREDKNMAQRYRYTAYHDPQAEEARIATYCCECGKPICEGYDYYRIHTDDYCEACMRGFAAVAEVEGEPWSWEDDA